MRNLLISLVSTLFLVLLALLVVPLFRLHRISQDPR